MQKAVLSNNVEELRSLLEQHPKSLTQGCVCEISLLLPQDGPRPIEMVELLLQARIAAGNRAADALMIVSWQSDEEMTFARKFCEENGKLSCYWYCETPVRSHAMYFFLDHSSAVKNFKFQTYIQLKPYYSISKAAWNNLNK